MLESLLTVRDKAVSPLVKGDISFLTSSASTTTITTSGLGTGFTTEYSIDGSPLTPAGTSFIVPEGDHEVTLKITVTTGTMLSMVPFSDILMEVTDWEGFRLPNIRFNNCSKLTKVPDYLPSAITVMSYMFSGCTVFNQDISNWDVGKVIDMHGTFYNCKAFNQDISQWDVSRVTNMSYMFFGCTSFNRDLSSMVFKSTVTRNSYDGVTTAWNTAYRPKFTG